MRIIIEGPDNVGKTTLIKNIIKEFKIPFIEIHSYAPPYKDTKNCLKFENEYISQMFKLFENFDSVIADRSHVGTMVYSPIYREYDGKFVLDLEKKEINKDYWKDTFLITLVDDPENLIKREDGLSFSIDPKLKQKEIDLFYEAHKLSLIYNKLIINIKDFNEEKLSKAVCAWISSIDNVRK